MTPSPLPDPTDAWLELPDGGLLPLGAACAIGRQQGNDLVLDLPTLSRRHALIAREDDGYAVSDLHSRNGTLVNRMAVTRPARLRDGDEIQIGEVTLRFRCMRPHAPVDVQPDYAATQRLDQVRERACWLLLADVVGFAAMNEALGSEGALRRMKGWFAQIRPLIEGRCGRINGYLGDAVFAHWPADTTPAAEVVAALAAMERWRAASPLEFRLVVHHGPVLFTHSDRGEELTGQQVNFLFRSEKLAKTFGVSALFSVAAAETLELGPRVVPCGEAAIDGMTGRHAFRSWAPGAAGAG
jgi:class 3 adenylate cyclase